MKKLFTTALALLVAMAGYSQMKKMSSTDSFKKMSTMRMESFENVESEPNMVRWNYEEGELDYTTYDWQTNAGPRNWTIVWPDGKVNFAYNMATSEEFSDIGTGIGTYDSNIDEWIPLYGRIENEKTLFGSIARFKDNGIVVASNANTQCGIYILEDKDNMIPNSVPAINYLDPTYDPYWPNVMTSGSNREYIHVVATANKADGTTISVPGAEGVNKPIIYFRSMDGGETWNKQNVILPYMDSEFGINWGSHVCYWMETTEDNCLALVVNNPWSDGMVIYSYDDGETWERKVFYHHPGINTTFDDWFMYPRWASCVWGADDELCLAYEFNCSTGEPGSSNYDPAVGGVAFWSENMPYFGIDPHPDPTNPLPPVFGQPFYMDSPYIDQDIWATSPFSSFPTHEMWPEYMGYLSGDFNLAGLGMHGDYNCGCVAMPVLCKVPNSDNDLVAVWIAIDDQYVDSNGNFYFKLFASYSYNGGRTWTHQIQLTDDFMWALNEFVYPQAAVIGTTLVVAVQMDSEAGSFVMDDDPESNENLFQGLTFELPLPIGVPEVSHITHMSLYPNPAVDRLNITLNKNATVTVYNLMGQAVMNIEGHVGANTLDISNLDSGIYFISAGSDTQKFIVK